MSRTLSFLSVLLLFATNIFSAADVEGTVTDKSSGSPIEGASVQLIRGGKERFSAITDSQGNYHFQDVQPSNYTIVAMKTGYQDSALGIKPRNNRTAIVNLQLVPVGASIVGLVADVGGAEPIAGAAVELFDGPLMIAATISATDGGCAFSDLLAAKSYRVVVKVQGFQSEFKSAILAVGQSATLDFELATLPGSLAGSIYDKTTGDPIAGATVQVFSGTTQIASVDTDLLGQYLVDTLPPGNYSALCTAHDYCSSMSGVIISGDVTPLDFHLDFCAGEITAQVKDAITDFPLAGAAMEIKYGAVVVANLYTDPDGFYSIDDLPAGSFSLSVSKKDYQSKTLGAIEVFGTITTVNLTLNPQPGAVTGNVSSAAAISNASVTVSDGNGVVWSTITDSNGDYTVEGLAPGNYTITVSAAGFQVQFKAAMVSSNATTVVNFTLSPDVGFLEGSVVDSYTLQPIQGAVVELLLGQTLVSTVLTDGAGNYNIPNLAPGHYNVRISAASFQGAVIGAAIVSGSTTNISFNLQPEPGIVSGKVRDSLSGVPLAGITVVIYKQFTQIKTATTDPSGNYLVGGLAPDNYIVTASAQGYSNDSVGAKVLSRNNSVANLTLASLPGSLIGHIIDSVSGDSISNVVVEIRRGPLLVGNALTDVDGNYRVEGLDPGSYCMTATKVDYRHQSRAVNIEANLTTTHNFSLVEKLGSLFGTVTAVSSEPISAASITVYQGIEQIATILSDINGQFRIKGIAPGSYNVVTQAPRFQTQTAVAVIDADQEVEQNFILESEPAAILGVVVDSGSKCPISGALVEASNGVTLVGFDLTDNEGSYSIKDLASGRNSILGSYKIIVSKKNYNALSKDVSLNSSEELELNFSLTSEVLPPKNISGAVIVDCYLSRRDRVYQINWTASPEPDLAGYMIFRNGKLIITVPPSQLSYQDHQRSKKADKYSVCALNSLGEVSDPVSVKVGL